MLVDMIQEAGLQDPHSLHANAAVCQWASSATHDTVMHKYQQATRKTDTGTTAYTPDPKFINSMSEIVSVLIQAVGGRWLDLLSSSLAFAHLFCVPEVRWELLFITAGSR